MDSSIPSTLPSVSSSTAVPASSPSFWQWIQTSISYLFFSSSRVDNAARQAWIEAQRPATSQTLTTRQVNLLPDASSLTWQVLQRMGWIPAKVIGGLISLAVRNQELRDPEQDLEGACPDLLEGEGTFVDLENKPRNEWSYWEAMRRFLASTQEVATNLLSNPMKFIRDLTVHQNLACIERHFRLVCDGLIESCQQQGVRIPQRGLPPSPTNTVLEEEVQRILSILTSPSYPSAMTQYRSFLYHLRQALKRMDLAEEQEIDPVSIKTLEALINGLFTGIHIHAYSEQVTERVLMAGLQALDQRQELSTIARAQSRLSLPDRLRLCREAVKRAGPEVTEPAVYSAYESFRGVCNVNFDPHAQINLPHVLYECAVLQRDGGTKCVPNIRMGTPTAETDSYIPTASSASIIPEFEFFIKRLAAENRRHLYVNFQLRTPCNESRRCEALEELQAKYPTCLSLVTLTKDSPFYYQTASTPHPVDAETFLEDFWQEMFACEDSGYYFCPELKTESFHQEVKELLTSTLHHRFPGKTSLTKSERRRFIDIFYVDFIKWLLRETEADSFNLSCKDCADRGAATSALLYWDYLLESGQTESQPLLQALMTLVFAPALMVKKRCIKKERLDDLIAAIEHMAKGKEKEDLPLFAPPISPFQILPFRRMPHQEPHPTCVNARSYAEYQQALTAHPSFDLPVVLPDLVTDLLSDPSLHQRYETFEDPIAGTNIPIHRTFADDVERRLVSINREIFRTGTREEKVLAAYHTLKKGVGEENLNTLNKMISLGNQAIVNSIWAYASEQFTNLPLDIIVRPALEEFDPPSNVNLVISDGQLKLQGLVILKLQRSDPESDNTFHPVFLKGTLEVDLNAPEKTTLLLNPLSFVEAFELKEKQILMDQQEQAFRTNWNIV